jgi:hypothetical protein
MPVGSDSISKETGHITTYLRVNNTPEALNHYTCKVSTVTGLTGRATVSVVFRVDEGGWSWWMETVPCSVTCGITEGIRMRSRRCYNESSRCPGDSLQRTTCYSPLLNCPFERNVSPTTMSVRNISTAPTILSGQNGFMLFRKTVVQYINKCL